MTTPPIKISEEALRLAREFGHDLDRRREVKGIHFANLIDEAVIVARELLRVAGESE